MKCKHCGSEWTTSASKSITLQNCPFCGKPLKEPSKKQFDTIEDVLKEILRLQDVKVFQHTNRTLAIFADIAPHMVKEKRILRYFLECNGSSMLLGLQEESVQKQRGQYEKVVALMRDDYFISESAAKSVCNAFWSAVYDVPSPAVAPSDASTQNTASQPQPEQENSEIWFQQGKAYETGGFFLGTTILQDLSKAFSYYEKAARSSGNTGEELLSMLERRLDNVVYRLGFAQTRRQARQLATHGHFTVNGQRVDIPSFQVKVGDVIEVREKSRSSVMFKKLVGEDAAVVNVPKWLESAKGSLRGTVVAMPARDDIDFPVEEHLIVELYSK